MGNSALQLLSSSQPGGRTVDPQQMALDFGGFFRNKFINPDFTVATNGTSYSTPLNGAGVLDGYLVSYDGTIGSFTVSQQSHTIGQTTVPDEPQFFMRWAHTSAGSGSSFRRLEQRIPSVRILAGKVATFTLYLKADSARNVTLDLVQNFGSGGSSDVVTSGGTLALTTAFQRFEVSVTVPSISGKTLGSGNYLALRLGLPINTTMTIEFSHFQLEENGSTAFEQRPPNIEQLLCLGLAGATFDNLAPTTTQGDTIFRNASTNTRLPIGTALQQLRTNAGATAPEWFTPTTPPTSIFTESFTSSEQTITAGGLLTLAHSLSASPLLIQLRLKCISTDLAYSANDIAMIDIGALQTTANLGTSVVPDSTNIVIRYGADAQIFYLLNKTTGNVTAIDPTKWKLIVKAFA